MIDSSSMADQQALTFGFPVQNSTFFLVRVYQILLVDGIGEIILNECIDVVQCWGTLA